MSSAGVLRSSRTREGLPPGFPRENRVQQARSDWSGIVEGDRLPQVVTMAFGASNSCRKVSDLSARQLLEIDRPLERVTLGILVDFNGPFAGVRLLGTYGPPGASCRVSPETCEHGVKRVRYASASSRWSGNRDSKRLSGSIVSKVCRPAALLTCRYTAEVRIRRCIVLTLHPEAHELRGEEVEQFRWLRRLRARSAPRLSDRGDEAGAKVVLPETVHHDPGKERDSPGDVFVPTSPTRSVCQWTDAKPRRSRVNLKSVRPACSGQPEHRAELPAPERCPCWPRLRT